jgi:hypothetical protein
MPALTLMVLDALADAEETIYSMRSCGEVAPYGLALVGEDLILEAVKANLADGFIEVAGERTEIGGRIADTNAVAEPQMDDERLRLYWYRMTPAGRRAWRSGWAELDAYWDADSV